MMHESKMQAILMNWCMEQKQHQLVMPNLRSIYRWEADLISLTKAWLVHEIEIKISASDYAADLNKKNKHALLLRSFSSGTGGYCPNYFWYATWGFEPESLPPYAGLIRIKEGVYPQPPFIVCVECKAPRLHTSKMREKTRLKISRWLSYKLKNEYYTKYIVNGTGS